VIYTIFALFVLSIVGLLLVIWSTYFYARWAAPSIAGRKVSQIMLLIYLLSRSLNLQIRTDLNALVTQGLTAQNRIQVAVVLCASAWAIYLLFRGRVAVQTLFAGPGFWISSSIVVFSLTVVWSVWPNLTLYRALELAAIWIICVHIFAHRDWFSQAHFFLWSILGMQLIDGFVGLSLHGPSNDGIVGVMRSNGGSALAATLIVWSFHCTRENGWSKTWWMLPIASGSLIVFGSLTSSFALLGGLAIYTYYRIPKSMKPILVCGFATVALVLLSLAYFNTGDLSGAASSGIQAVSTMFDKSPEALRSATGRVQLWTAMWEASKENPLGYGFAAAERVFSADRSLVGWAPGPGGAHNGYLSGLFGSGWLGASFVLLVFISMWLRIRQTDNHLIPLTMALLFMMAFNNLSLAMFGGAIAPVTIIIMILALVSPDMTSGTCRQPGGSIANFANS
jgi:O-antigen ligase